MRVCIWSNRVGYYTWPQVASAQTLVSSTSLFFFFLSFFSSNASVFKRKTVERLPSHDSDVCPARSAIQQRLGAFIWVRVTTDDKFVFYQTSSSMTRNHLEFLRQERRSHQVPFDKYIRSELFAGILSLSLRLANRNFLVTHRFFLFSFFFLKAYVGRTHTE